MSFQSKRLRVQLPCPEENEGSIREVELHPFPTNMYFCLNTCVFQENSHRVGCEFDTCGANLVTRVPVCPAGSNWPPICDAGSEPIDPRVFLVDPEILPMMHEQLEVQLQHVKTAMEQVADWKARNE